MFQGAWTELLEGRFRETDHLGDRVWVVAPKEAGANTTARLRDVEVCETARKILARMTNRVLQEVCANSISRAQQAFIHGRDIVRNNVRLHTAFRDMMAEADEGNIALSDLGMLLLLDCTKGYNLLDREWIRRCLEAAKLPSGLRQLIETMLESEAVLMLDRREMGAVKFELGIPQGCPLSCFLYIICADPFLAALERTEQVGLSTIGLRRSEGRERCRPFSNSSTNSKQRRGNRSTRARVLWCRRGDWSSGKSTGAGRDGLT